MKHIATVPAALIKGALHMQAKGDVRYHLNGIMIDVENIVSTDGHAMFCAPHKSDVRPEEPIIISIKGKIPPRAHSLELLYDEENEVGIIRCVEPTPLTMKVRNLTTGKGEPNPPKPLAVMDKQGHQQMVFFHKIDGRFPDYKKVIPSGDLIPTDAYGVNCEIMARVAKALKDMGQKSGMVKASMRGANSSIVLEPLSGIIAYVHEGVKFIVMPCRID